MLFALYLLSIYNIGVSFGDYTFDNALKEINQFNEYSGDLIEFSECGNQYDNLKNGYVKELVEDDVWFTYFFDTQNVDICSRLELLWDDINTELDDNLKTIIQQQEYDNCEAYNIDISIISQIKTYFGVYEYLLDEEVKTDLAFYALSWLTSRKKIHSSVSDFCDNNNRINTLTDELLSVTDKCVLNMYNDNRSNNNNNRRLLQIFGNNNRTRDNRTCEERIAENLDREVAIQATINIGVVLQFEFGIGIFATLEGPIIDISIYKTMGIGILLPFEVTLQISIFNFNFPFSGRDLLNAKGKWTLGASVGIGGGFSWIRNSRRRTIATSINFGIGVGLSIVDHVWFISDQTEVINTLFDVDICARLRNITENIDIENPFEETQAPTPLPGSPTVSPTIKPESGTDINLFDDNNQNLWTVINGNWSNFERQGFSTQISVTDDNLDNGDELNTIWIGTQFPETLAWFDYTVKAELEISDNIINGVDSVGFIFGVQENINEAYYYGIYLNTVIFGIFDSFGNFNIIEEFVGFDIDSDSRNPSVELEAVFKPGDITLRFEGVPIKSSYDVNELSSGSVGLRTIGKSGKYSSFEISF